LELTKVKPIPTNCPIPIYVPTIDRSQSTNFRLLQQHYKGRCISPNDPDSEDPLLQVPTVTVAGMKYDVRTLTAEQIDLLQERVHRIEVISEEVFLQKGESGRMYERMRISFAMLSNQISERSRLASSPRNGQGF
jgi:hypothetical protein